jgi:hypothetical protein
VLLAEDVQHVAAHNALHLRRTRKAKHNHCRPKVIQIIHHLGRAPGRIRERARIHAAHINVENHDPQEHPQQSE